jgi:hypothetical protein
LRELAQETADQLHDRMGGFVLRTEEFSSGIRTFPASRELADFSTFILQRQAVVSVKIPATDNEEEAV